VEDIRFDDIEKLKSKVSDAFGGWSEPTEVTQDMINKFADLTGDHQWVGSERPALIYEMVVLYHPAIKR